MKNAFMLGMRSTQLSENINSNIKSCTRPNLNINQFFNQFERIVQEKKDTMSYNMIMRCAKRYQE